MSKKNKKGSKIIICTDGIANRGLGSLDPQDLSNFETSREFYNKIGLLAKEHGIVISVISIVDSECRLDILSPIAQLTGGNILKVNPSQLSNDFKNCLNDSLVATKVKCEIRIHKYFEFCKVIEGKLFLGNSCLTREIGNVTRGTMITFECRIKPWEILKKMNLSEIQDIKYCPIQVLIFYENLKGWKCLKVLTINNEITRNEEELENGKNSMVIGSHVHKVASMLSLKGEYKSATNYIDKSLKKFQIDMQIVQKLKPLSQALQIQNSILQKPGLNQHNDVLSFETIQSFKQPLK